MTPWLRLALLGAVAFVAGVVLVGDSVVTACEHISAGFDSLRALR